jgi:uncharacterized protein (DUF2345 family)
VTQQRITLEVPSPSASTLLTLGLGRGDAALNVAGMSVETEARVWLDARGGDPAESTLSALSNGPAGRGGLLVQSLTGDVRLFARDTSVVASSRSMLLAGGAGLKVVGGHGAPLPLADSPKIGLVVTAGDESLLRVAPGGVQLDEATGLDPAREYLAHVDEVSSGWEIADTAVSGAVAAVEAGLALAQCQQGAKLASTGAALFALGSAARTATAAIDPTVLGGATQAGLQVHAFGAVAFRTTGFCSLHAGVGVVLSGMTCASLGLMTAAVAGGANASVKALYRLLVEGEELDLVASRDVKVRSRRGVVVATGAEVVVGASGDEARTQRPTRKITVDSTEETLIKSDGDAILRAGSQLLIEGESISFFGDPVEWKGTDYAIKTGGTVELSTGATTRVSVGKSVEAKADGGARLAVEGKGVTVATAQTTITVDERGSVMWKAPQVAVL